jgi:hypothetical protein
VPRTAIAWPGWCAVSERDALLVTETSGRPLRTLDPHVIDDELLEGIWRNAGRLHTLGVAHRRGSCPYPAAWGR